LPHTGELDVLDLLNSFYTWFTPGLHLQPRAIAETPATGGPDPNISFNPGVSEQTNQLLQHIISMMQTKETKECIFAA
jgi:hypothetical protein